MVNYITYRTEGFAGIGVIEATLFGSQSDYAVKIGPDEFELIGFGDATGERMIKISNIFPLPSNIDAWKRFIGTYLWYFNKDGIRQKTGKLGLLVSIAVDGKLIFPSGKV